MAFAALLLLQGLGVQVMAGPIGADLSLHAPSVQPSTATTTNTSVAGVYSRLPDETAKQEKGSMFVCNVLGCDACRRRCKGNTSADAEKSCVYRCKGGACLGCTFPPAGQSTPVDAASIAEEVPHTTSAPESV